MNVSKNQLYVLRLLTSLKGEKSASEIADAADELSRSSLYAAIAALQRDGLIEARWDVSGARPRRRFRVTSAGVRVFEAERHRLGLVVPLRRATAS